MTFASVINYHDTDIYIILLFYLNKSKSDCQPAYRYAILNKVRVCAGSHEHILEDISCILWMKLETLIPR